MHTRRVALRLALALSPSVAVSELLTVTQYASTCSANYPNSTALYTSGSSTYSLPLIPSWSTSSGSSPPGTAAARVSLCPGYNGQYYISPQCGTYSVYCDIAITGTRLSGIQIRQASHAASTSQQDCIVACRQSDACVALNIDVDSCEYFSSIIGTTDAVGSIALVKRPSASVAASSYAIDTQSSKPATPTSLSDTPNRTLGWYTTLQLQPWAVQP